MSSRSHHILRSSWAFGLVVVLFVSCTPHHERQQVSSLARTHHNLHCIGEAIVEYRAKNARLPMKADDSLSWRVHLLPFLGEIELYDKFRLDEPWNSENNIKLVPEIPRVYEIWERAGAVSTSGKTCYLAVIPENASLKPEVAEHRTVLQERDDVAIVVQVEPAHAVIWTKPDDWEYDSSAPLKHLYVHLDKCVSVLTLDGAVWAVPTTNDTGVYDYLFSWKVSAGERQLFGSRVTFADAVPSEQPSQR